MQFNIIMYDLAEGAEGMMINSSDDTKLGGMTNIEEKEKIKKKSR